MVTTIWKAGLLVMFGGPLSNRNFSLITLEHLGRRYKVSCSGAACVWLVEKKISVNTGHFIPEPMLGVNFYVLRCKFQTC